MTTAAIEIADLALRLGGRTLFEGFSMSVAHGEKVALTGRSGSGKSSLLRALLGFVVPVEGEIYIDGLRLDAETVWQVRRRLAYVAQEPVLGAGTTRQVLARPFAYRANASLASNLGRTGEFFERFILRPDLLDKDASTLSGGEKQRVAIISAILLERRIFLLDEPSSALDAAGKEAVAEFFNSRGDLTVLSVFHDTGQLSYSERVVELRRGGAAA